MSRRPSAGRLKPSTASMIAAPGKTTTWGRSSPIRRLSSSATRLPVLPSTLCSVTTSLAAFGLGSRGFLESWSARYARPVASRSGWGLPLRRVVDASEAPQAVHALGEALRGQAAGGDCMVPQLLQARTAPGGRSHASASATSQSRRLRCKRTARRGITTDRALSSSRVPS